MSAAAISRARKQSEAHVALGGAVRESRARRGLSQEELGFRAGLHRNYVGAIERGGDQSDVPDSDLAFARARAAALGAAGGFKNGSSVHSCDSCRSHWACHRRPRKSTHPPAMRQPGLLGSAFPRCWRWLARSASSDASLSSPAISGLTAWRNALWGASGRSLSTAARIRPS